MAKYHNWTFGDAEALINVLGGDEIARAIKDRKLKVTVESIMSPQPPARPRLVGRVWKTIVVPSYRAQDFAAAVRLGKFDNADSLGDIKRLWGKEPVGFDKPVTIDLVEFDRNWEHDEVVAWGKEFKKTPMLTAHTMGIAAGLPNEQRERPIVQVTSVQGGSALYLRGDSVWRDLDRPLVASAWDRLYVVGFLSESQP